MPAGSSWTGGIRRSLAAPPALAGIIHPWLALSAFMVGGAYLVFVLVLVAAGASKLGSVMIGGMIAVVFGVLGLGVVLTKRDPDWPTVLLMSLRCLPGYRKGGRYVA